jgi:predicted nucleic acid-binding protein
MNFMSAEFIDTNLLIYAHHTGAPSKHEISNRLVKRLVDEHSGCLSAHVLAEFYSVWTGKLRRSSEEAEEIMRDFRVWMLHGPAHADLIRASQLHRKHQISWWDAMIVNSAMELGAHILWTEDMKDGQTFGGVTIRNPFR